MNLQKIEHQGELLAIVRRADEWPDGLSFCTPDELFIQAGTWQYDAGKELAAHRHKFHQRSVTKTQEVAYVKRGRLRVKVYSDDGELIAEPVLASGDFIVLAAGGHGYEILEDGTQVLEVKNGPFIDVAIDKEALAVK
jgi:uncharacterized protein YjlB